MTVRCDSRIPLLLALAAVVLHGALFGTWIVDDAGITFAYSRNLAAGHGLVAQPGTPPVEGFSNPLWTLLLAVPYALGVFHETWTPKAIALALIAATFVFIRRDLAARGASCFAIAVPLLLLASCSSFVIWTASGLENALLACLVAASCAIARRTADGDGRRRDAAAGVVAAGLALTRPDALLYAVVQPLVILAAERPRDAGQVRTVLRRSLMTAVGFLPVYGGYLLFRIAYFGALVPNTYFAKQKPSLAFATPGKFLDLIESATGDLMVPVLVWTAFAVATLVWRRRLTLPTATLLAYLGIAIGGYLVMPSDWMGEFRFATPFYVLFYWAQTELARDFAKAMAPAAGAQRAFRLATVAFVLQAVFIFAGRSTAFAAYPTVPLDEVRTFAADGFNHLAEALGAADASVLTPDLGGALLDSRLRVYDLAGLCDKTIAAALSRGDYDRFYAYVFDEVKPTFIHTHGNFTRWSRLYDSPRFAQDYVTLNEVAAGPPPWRAMFRDRVPPPWAGDYVRRDALGADLGGLPAIAQAYARAGLSEFSPWVRPPDRLTQGWPQVVWSLSSVRDHWRVVPAGF
jgi:hypothetical protein